MKEPIAERRSELDIFHEFFPEGKFEEIVAADLPQDVLAFFERKNESSGRDLEDDSPVGFERIFRVTYPEYTSYCAIKNKKIKWEANKLWPTTEVYIEDIAPTGEKIGHGEIVRVFKLEKEYFKDKPYVGFTRTEEPFQNRGYAKKRLFLMNALSHVLWRLPINSDTLIAAPARKIWNDLVEVGLAVKYKEGSHDRYKFIK